MPSWLRKSYSRSKTEVLDGKSGKSKTTRPDAGRGPDGERPLVKMSTDYGMYHSVAKHGQPDLIPVWIKVYNLDWDELLPVLRDAYPNQTFTENVRLVSVYISPCACVLTWRCDSRWGSRIITRSTFRESLRT